MNSRIHRIVYSLSFFPLRLGLLAVERQFTGLASAPGELLSLWYRQPAARWTDALAIANGRLGAMVFGGIGREWLQSNEDTLYDVQRTGNS